MSRNKSLNSELDVTLAPKTDQNEQPLEMEKVSRGELIQSPVEGFAAVSERLNREVGTRATISTTVRLPEESDMALKEACAKFRKSKADLMKICVEEFLKANHFLRERSNFVKNVS